jgi:lipopolysaccharide/colanic/teichoic acid biosynthesis glycosyltransferase
LKVQDANTLYKGAEMYQFAGIGHGDRQAGPHGFELSSQRLTELRAKKLWRRTITILLVASDIFSAFLAIAVGNLIEGRLLNLTETFAILVCCLPVYFLAALQLGAHNPEVATKVTSSIKKAAGVFAITAAIFFFALFFTNFGDNASRLLVGEILLLCFVFGITGRCILARVAQRHLGSNAYATLCIYEGVSFSPASGVGAISASDFGLIPDLNRPEMVSMLGNLARGMDVVVVHCPPEQRKAWAHLLKCVEVRSEIVVPEISDLRPLQITRRGGEASVVLANGPLSLHQRISKRLFDMFFVLLALPPTAIVMLVIAVIVKLDSPGPALFAQQRIGIGNRTFKMLKFRTMHVAMQDENASTLTLRDDPRVTRVGAFLRGTSLDELPQLINVLMGQMSLVGPRPHALKALAGTALYWEVDSSYWLRHSVTPGITGLAQVRGHRGNTFEKEHLLNRLQADLEYVNSWSLLGDLRILLSTLLVLRKNAF